MHERDGQTSMRTPSMNHGVVGLKAAEQATTVDKEDTITGCQTLKTNTNISCSIVMFYEFLLNSLKRQITIQIIDFLHKIYSFLPLGLIPFSFAYFLESVQPCNYLHDCTLAAQRLGR